MADNQYGYSTGYPGFAGQPAAAQGANQFVNYPQWNAQANFPGAANPYSQPPPTAPAPAGYPQAYSQPPPPFPQAQAPTPQPPSNFGVPNQYGSKDGNQYNRSGGGGGGGSGGYNNRNSGYDSGGERNSGGRSGGGNYNSGANRGGYAKGPVDTRTGELVVQQDTIFISGMDPHTTESQIVTHFGAIGIIKNDKKTNKPKVWMYTDKQTGRPKGEATVTFEDPFTASSAIEWFDGKEFNGNTISVQLASRRDNWQGGRGGRGGGGGGGGGGGRGRGRGGPPRDDRDGYDDGGRGGYSRDDEDNGYGRDRDFGGRGGGFRGRGGGDRSGGGGYKGGDRDGGRGGRGDRQGGGGRSDRGGGGGYGGREGDWRCPNSECGNTNFSWRQQCNRCNEDKPADAGGSGGGDFERRGGGGRGGGGGGGRGGGFGGSRGRGGGGGGGRGGGGGGAMRNDYSNNRNRPY